MASSQQPARPARQEPVLITEAEIGRDEQLARRKRRYAITMLVRAASVILAVCLLHVIPLWLDLSLAFLGTFLPGFAVVMANDRPAKKPLFPRRYDARPGPALESKPHPVIEG